MNTICHDRALEDAMAQLRSSHTSISHASAIFQEVYRLAWRPVVRCIECATGNPALAEDVAQETFIKVWNARASYQPGAKVLPWMRTIARRTLIDVLRRARLERRSLRHIQRATEETCSRLDEATDARRTSRALQVHMAQLPSKQNELLRLLVTEGGSLVQLAERLGDSPLAVRLRLHRARATLRRSLEQQGAYHWQ